MTSTASGMIYLLLEEGSNRAYVGKTVQPISWRWRQHQEKSRRQNRTRKDKWLKEAMTVGKTVSFQLVEVVAVNGLSEAERKWQRVFEVLGYELQNSVTCGCGGRVLMS